MPTRDIAKSGGLPNWCGFSPFGLRLGLKVNRSQSASCHIAKRRRKSKKQFAISSGGEFYEQSLILIQDHSIVLLTGCSHSGIVDMVKTTKEIFPEKNIELVAGGFHLIQKSISEIKDISNNLNKLGVEKIAPSHCTGDNAISLFKEDWREKFVDLNLGNEFTM